MTKSLEIFIKPRTDGPVKHIAIGGTELPRRALCGVLVDRRPTARDFGVRMCVRCAYGERLWVGRGQ